MSKMRRLKIVLGLWALCVSSTARAEATKVMNQADVVALAAKHNPGLKASLLNVESARWEVFGQEARYAPVLLLDASATQTTTPSLFIDSVNLNRVRRVDTGAEVRKHLIWGTDLSLRLSGSWQKSRTSLAAGFSPAGTFGPGWGLIAKLSLKQPLLRGRGREVGEAQLLAARAQRTSNEYARDRVASQLVRDSLTAYWELWYADTAVHIEEESRAVAQKQRDDAQARADTGGLAPSEVLAFDTQVATREESVLAAVLTRKQRELELLTQLGMVEQGAEIQVAGEDPTVASVSREHALKRAFDQSAQLKEQQAALELARLQSKTSADPQRARLDLDSYVQTQGLGYDDVGDSVEQFASHKAVSAFIGLTYEAPLNDHTHRAAAAKARLAVEVAEENLRQTRERIVSELDLTLERRASAERRVELANRTLEIARKQLEAQEARFATGAATPLSVLEAEDQVRNAQTRVARAQADLAEAALALQHLTGELLERYAALSR